MPANQIPSGGRSQDTSSTSTPPVPRSVSGLLASLPQERTTEFIEALSHNALMALPWLFEHWAHDHQLPPEGDWDSWIVLGGRGAGKTRAGSEWVRAQVEGAGPMDPGKCTRVALVGETYDQVRSVMVKGESGILAVCPPDRRPVFKESHRQLIWPNGAVATMYSVADPEALRGPQFDAAWVDELAKWDARKGREAWENLQLCLRLGERPRVVVTTTPRDVALLKELREAPSTVETHAPTRVNRAFLAEGFVERIEGMYGGTAMARQELEGELVEAREGAFWSRSALDACRLADLPEMDRVVVAVDPPVTSGKRADECGIVVAGVVAKGAPQTWRAYVLADLSLHGAPAVWVEAALEGYHAFKADRIVAEVNQGGDLVETLLRTMDAAAAFTGVHATRGKEIRAEPVAALYEQGRVHHVGGFAALEDQMCAMTAGGYTGRGSPDRMDALVWALTALMIDPAKDYRAPPGIRGLGR